ncbi:hypothetical protein CGLO_07968 [Colletotrichum gloeosporioides Cg-14]|uniref:2EXR domain-containing protein n=1 Tax=Colletotrichum gloeosporioides (strain Cg-14) TaxID=1237896 RepID=T0KJN1_COLGC|nr:hypothetical protein CGLO_07968 [Colletotrichum gloeosporioides Cg-14]
MATPRHASWGAAAAGVTYQLKIIEHVARIGHDLSLQRMPPKSLSDKELKGIQKELVDSMEVQARLIDRILGINAPPSGSGVLETSTRPKVDPGPTFHRFSRLPPELRHMIWELALPGTRFFRPWRDDGGIHLYDEHETPAILYACRESRQVAEKHGDFEFGSRASRSQGFWFNYKRDIAFIHDSIAPLVGPDIACSLFNCINLAVESLNFTSPEDCIKTMKWILRHAPKCQKVIIWFRPWFDDIEPEHWTPRMFAFRDDEDIWGKDFRREMYQNQPGDDTWRGTKRILESLYSQKETLDRLGITKEHLPELEGKEVLRAFKSESPAKPHT